MTDARCTKVVHDPERTGYLHTADDDGPYSVDGVLYCGRCHHVLPHAESYVRPVATKRKQGYRTVVQLLTKAALDLDPVSIFVDGLTWADGAAAIIVVKGAPLAKQLHDEFVARGLVTLGKAVDKPAPKPPICCVCGKPINGQSVKVAGGWQSMHMENCRRGDAHA